MASLKQLTLLHSNDMHGDFLAQTVDDRLLGGVSMLSGYLSMVRQQEPNVLYAISGDMFQGSLIDSEFKGLSTIEIINMLAPDVVTLGNHEVDYGIAHLLFVEKCARFPLINANLYLKHNHVRLFEPCYIREIDGMKIRFIGVLTEDVLAMAQREHLIGAFVDVRNPVAEIGKICNRYHSEDVDLTVLLTHVGFEEDKKLAARLDPAWGVDLIIGGHSHTLLKEPAVVNGIPIVQAASGTDQIGRFDLTIDTDCNCLADFQWHLIPITDEHCPRDHDLEEIILKFKQVTDEKYNRYLTRLDRAISHPARNRETGIGRLFSDILRDCLGLDLMLLASGSIRGDRLGPIVEYRHLAELLPFQDEIYTFTLDGSQLKRAIRHLFRPEVFDGIHTEFYQFSSGITVTVSPAERCVTSLLWHGAEIDDSALFKIGMQTYHFNNAPKFLGLSKEELSLHSTPKILATDVTGIIDEYLSRQERVKCPTDRRWITL